MIVLIVYYDGITEEEIKKIFKKEEERRSQDDRRDNIRNLRMLENKIDKQQANIKELEKNFDDLVEWASEIAKRNVELDEKNGQLQRENEQLRKIGVMYQGHNPCEICTYSLENKVCCAESIPISCDDAKKNFIQGLCKNHKQFQKSFRRYDDE